jgi:quercetin dioxygenase-like cupin family protein
MKSLLLLLGVTGGLFAETVIPARQEPHHHVLFENDVVRILDVRLPPGEATLEHSHDHDDSSVCISGSNMRNKSGTSDWSQPGQPCTIGRASVTQWTGTPGSHVVGNAGDKLFRLVLVENLHETFLPDYSPLNEEIVTRENRGFRIFEMQMAAASEKSHTHKKPMVAILISGDAQFDEKLVSDAGAWIYVPAGQPHKFIAKADSRITEVELR